mgnify:CR=1 FL=1
MTEFRNRHIGTAGDSRGAMLSALGYATLDELMEVVPGPDMPNGGQIVNG